MIIRKAVIPAAGFGTRFLPATKAQPKEMLPIIDTPVIQFVVEEATQSGVEDILMVTGRGKRAIEDHFDRSIELEMLLAQGKKLKLRQAIEDISEIADIHYIRQKKMLGLGHAVLQARTHVDQEPFAVLLGDTIVHSSPPCTKQLVDMHGQLGRSIIAVEEVPMEKVSRYGVIKGREVAPNLYLLDQLVEKPSPKRAPSNLAIAGRYVLTSRIFRYLDETTPGKNGEIQLTDGLNLMAANEDVYAYKFDGKRYDIGNQLDYLKAGIEFGLRRRDLANDLRAFLEEMVRETRASGVKKPRRKRSTRGGS